MTGVARNAAAVVVGALLGLLGLGLTPPAAAAAPEPPDGIYLVEVETKDVHYHYRLCIKSDTVRARPRGDGSDRHCIPKMTIGLPIPIPLVTEYKEGDSIYMDVEMFTGLAGESVTKDNINITGARTCWLSGLVHAGKFECDSPINSVNFSPPAIEPYTINTNEHGSVQKLLNFMAWLVSAAAVTGLLITGATLASQLRRGALEERTEYTKHLAFVVAACLLATTAGPIVSWLALVK
ncbi:hypothetical protein [Micromonospora radicis]|uniref:Uncharacterized protein n=1 Tax=Micromonospora radicis TaxID=1894971 RepID=A0A418MYP8_9ACTN|nr:hypothetical protein [Micromonospora radicis]RIV40207.1 hypothetical protein D2L64_04930 [Micromonospora radicis]